MMVVNNDGKFTNVQLYTHHFNKKQILFKILGVAVRTTIDATLTNNYCAVLSRLVDQVK